MLLMWSVPKLAALFTLPVVLLSAGLAGGSVSTLRAVIMVSVFLSALLLDQKEEVLLLQAFLVSHCFHGKNVPIYAIISCAPWWSSGNNHSKTS